jgi:hypothetical protein
LFDDVVLPAEQTHVQQLGDFDHPGADAVIDIVVVIGDFIGQVGNLGFEAGLLPVEEPLADIAEFAGIAHRAMLEDSFAALERQVEAWKFGVAFFELIDHPQ